MKLHRYVDHQRLHIVTKDVISLSISVLLLFRHYISHKITFGAPSSGGVLCSACGAFIAYLEQSYSPRLMSKFHYSPISFHHNIFRTSRQNLTKVCISIDIDKIYKLRLIPAIFH